MYFYPTHQDILSKFSNNVRSFKKNLFRMRGSLNMFTKLTRKRKRGWANADITEEGRKGGWGNADNG